MDFAAAHAVVRNESILAVVIHPGRRAIAVHGLVLGIATGCLDLVHRHAHNQAFFNGPFVFLRLGCLGSLSGGRRCRGRLGRLSRTLVRVATRTAASTKAG